jgi:hypothetical protein
MSLRDSPTLSPPLDDIEFSAGIIRQQQILE